MLNAIDVYRYRLPLASPLRLARGEAQAERNGLLVLGRTSDGVEALAEAAPLPGFSVETLEESHAALEAFRAECLPFEIDPEEPAFSLWARLPDYPDSARFALAMLLSQVQARARAVPLARTLLDSARDPIHGCGLLPADRDAGLAKAAALREAGFTVVKAKILPASAEENAAYIGEVAQVLGAGARIRVDANAQWPLEEALCFCNAVRADTVDYVEEPLREVEQLPAYVDGGGLPFALDESLRGWTAGALELRHEVVARARAWVWKPSLHFDRTWLRRLERRIREGAGPAVVISGAFESGVGLALLTHLAAAFGGGAPAGLDTYGQLADDVLLARHGDLAPVCALLAAPGLAECDPGRIEAL